MSSESQPAAVPIEQVNGVEDLQRGVEGLEFENNASQIQQQQQQQQPQGDITSIPLPPVEAALHRACGEGNLDAVRAVLSNGLEALETLDLVTGCTPIVLAIRNNHYDVVRELLSAGAIVPPPGLTNDQIMLSILYSQQPVYSMPPYMHPTPEYYSQQGPGGIGHMYGAPGQGQAQGQGPNGYHPMGPGAGGMHGGFQQGPIPGQHLGHGHGHGHSHAHAHGPSGFQPRRDRGNSIHRTDLAPGQPNLPPAEVAKMIPCRNFPNCKYGNSCLFFHPNRPMYFACQSGPNGLSYDQQQQQQQQYQQGGFPAGQEQNPANDVYSQPQYPQDGQIQSTPNQQQQQQPPPQIQEIHEPQSPAEAESQPTANENQNLQSSQGMQPFVPAFQPAQSIPIPEQATFIPVASPLSPSNLAGSLPPTETFFAQSQQPPFPVQPFVPMDNRRQSFGQFGANPGAGGRSYGHGKKPSFSGGPRPFAPRGQGVDLGKWKDGVPPNCVFFGQGRCRNGEMCKFPHIDAEGNDCRNPDVIKGSIPPLPVVAPRIPRAPRQSFGHGPATSAFDPVQRQNQLAFLQQQRAAVQQAQNQGSTSANSSAPVNATTDSASVSATPTAAPSTVATPTNDSDMAASQTLVDSISDLGASVPATASKEASATAAVPTIAEETTPTLTPASVPATATATASTDAAEPAPATAVGAETPSATAAAASPLPAKPTGALPPTVARSASQPGAQRVHANGPHAHSRMPFHPNARRGAAPNANGNGVQGRHFANGNNAPGMNARSASAEGQMRGPRGNANGNAHGNTNGNANANGNGNGNGNGQAQNKGANSKSQQRIPRADEFPALGGAAGAGVGAANGVASATTSPRIGAVSGNGKTAAQVLSAPAPVKAVPAPAPAPAVAAASESKDKDAQSDEESITMDSDNESDGVIISCKPSSAQQSAPVSRHVSPVKSVRSTPVSAPLSFASIAGAFANGVSSGSNGNGGSNTVDAAPVAVKA